MLMSSDIQVLVVLNCHKDLEILHFVKINFSTREDSNALHFFVDLLCSCIVKLL